MLQSSKKSVFWIVPFRILHLRQLRSCSVIWRQWTRSFTRPRWHTSATAPTPRGTAWRWRISSSWAPPRAAAAARAVLAAKAARALAAQPMPAGALAAGGAPLTGNFGSGGAGAGALLPSVEEPAVPQQWLGGRADPAFYTLLLLLSLAGCGLCTACHVVLRCLDGESQQKRS